MVAILSPIAFADFTEQHEAEYVDSEGVIVCLMRSVVVQTLAPGPRLRGFTAFDFIEVRITDRYQSPS